MFRDKITSYVDLRWVEPPVDTSRKQVWGMLGYNIHQLIPRLEQREHIMSGKDQKSTVEHTRSGSGGGPGGWNLGNSSWGSYLLLVSMIQAWVFIRLDKVVNPSTSMWIGSGDGQIWQGPCWARLSHLPFWMSQE